MECNAAPQSRKKKLGCIDDVPKSCNMVKHYWILICKILVCPCKNFSIGRRAQKILEKINKKGQEAKTICDAEMWTMIGFLLEKKCIN